MIWMTVALIGVLAATLLVFVGRNGRATAGGACVSRRGTSAAKSAKSAKASNRSRQSAARGSGSGSRRDRGLRRPNGPYAAVAINPGKNPCGRVLERANVRYLSSAAPTVPVLGCDSGNCQCGFTHFEDRRSTDDNDRRIGIGLRSELYGTSEQGERRQRRGRRIGDH